MALTTLSELATVAGFAHQVAQSDTEARPEYTQQNRYEFNRYEHNHYSQFNQYNDNRVFNDNRVQLDVAPLADAITDGTRNIAGAITDGTRNIAGGMEKIAEQMHSDAYDRDPTTIIEHDLFKAMWKKHFQLRREVAFDKFMRCLDHERKYGSLKVLNLEALQEFAQYCNTRMANSPFPPVGESVGLIDVSQINDMIMPIATQILSCFTEEQLRRQTSEGEGVVGLTTFGSTIRKAEFGRRVSVGAVVGSPLLERQFLMAMQHIGGSSLGRHWSMVTLSHTCNYALSLLGWQSQHSPSDVSAALSEARADGTVYLSLWEFVSYIHFAGNCIRCGGIAAHHRKQSSQGYSMLICAECSTTCSAQQVVDLHKIYAVVGLAGHTQTFGTWCIKQQMTESEMWAFIRNNLHGESFAIIKTNQSCPVWFGGWLPRTLWHVAAITAKVAEIYPNIEGSFIGSFALGAVRKFRLRGHGIVTWDQPVFKPLALPLEDLNLHGGRFSSGCLRQMHNVEKGPLHYIDAWVRIPSL